jgi:hypothetical protein
MWTEICSKPRSCASIERPSRRADVEKSRPRRNAAIELRRTVVSRLRRHIVPLCRSAEKERGESRRDAEQLEVSVALHVPPALALAIYLFIL